MRKSGGDKSGRRERERQNTDKYSKEESATSLGHRLSLPWTVGDVLHRWHLMARLAHPSAHICHLGARC
eukprot:873759-Pleurochrysis_carterae.AAC.1